MKQVQGRRSPRWAVWSKMLIPCKDGSDYLFRVRIIQTPWFGVFLHDIYEDDGDRDCHNHPWSFLSIVLRGEYTERYYPEPETRPTYYVLKRHTNRSIHKMGRTAAHRIIDASPRLKTLILTGPRQSTWGFFCDGVFIDWQDYEREIGTL